MYDTTFISKCCREAVEEDTEAPGTGEAWRCTKCHRSCDVEEVCAICFGEGEVSTMEPVYPNEPHMAPIGMRKCICQIKEEEYDDQD